MVLLNHQSALDTLALMEVWPLLGRLAPVQKAALMYNGPFGLASWLIGGVFVERGAQRGRDAINKAGREAKVNNIKLAMFPEGTRNAAKADKLLPFKKGAFHVALDAKLPILPVVISEYDFLDHGRMRFSPGRVVIRALPPIDTDGYGKETIDDLVEVTRNKMLEAFLEISGHAKSD